MRRRERAGAIESTMTEFRNDDLPASRPGALTLAIAVLALCAIAVLAFRQHFGL